MPIFRSVPRASDREAHPAALRDALAVREGRLSRREFLTRATALGVSAAGAYGLVGAVAPGRARAAIREGGVLRIESLVKALKDPRSYDWPQMSNFSRGWLEYLAEYQRDGSLTPMLLEGWEANEDATAYVLDVRRGVRWNDGRPFTAADVARNIARWCDGSAEGNSMAGRMLSLTDPDTGMVRDGAVEVVDDHRLRLNLSSPDITLIASFSDYPAAIVPPDFSGDPMESPVGTGPFLPETFEVGVRAVLTRNRDHEWWGTEVFGGPYLDRIEFVDYGTDKSTVVAAVDSDEVDMLYESLGDYIEILDDLGWTRSEAVTANTVVIRTNQRAEIDGAVPYADARVRRALAMAVSNAVCLELGYADRGIVAENHHVCPIHPEYADIGPAVHDPEGALELMTEAGMADFEHELISIDDDWRRPTADAVAAQLRSAGFRVKRTVLPGATFWNDWANYAFSATDWAQRPLGVQVLALAYRSGEPWNETGFSNAEFDELLAEALSLADAERRREVTARLQTILRDEGVVIQPYWRSTFRHYRPGVEGAEMHPAFEIHVAKLGFSA